MRLDYPNTYGSKTNSERRKILLERVQNKMWVKTSRHTLEDCPRITAKWEERDTHTKERTPKGIPLHSQFTNLLSNPGPVLSNFPKDT